MKSIAITFGLLFLFPSTGLAKSYVPYDPYNYLIHNQQHYIPGPITYPYDNNSYLYSNRPVGQASLKIHSQYDYPNSRYQTSYSPYTGNNSFSYTTFGSNYNQYQLNNTYNSYPTYTQSYNPYSVYNSRLGVQPYGGGLSGSSYYGYRMLNYNANPYGSNQQNYGYGY